MLIKTHQPRQSRATTLPKAVALSDNEPKDSLERSTGAKVFNSAVWATAGATVAGLGVTAVVANSISGPGALGSLLLAPAFAAVGGIAGGVAGWQIAKKPPTLTKKLLNAGATGIAGAVTAGVAAPLAIASAMNGPDSLGLLILAPVLATAGGVGGAYAGWKALG